MNSILCVDDDKAGLRIRVLLLRSFGFEVEGTTEPDTAMRLLHDQHFDIVVVDYFLSTMSGTELARMMKLEYTTIPVLLFSGTAEVPLGLELCRWISL